MTFPFSVPSGEGGTTREGGDDNEATPLGPYTVLVLVSEDRMAKPFVPRLTLCAHMLGSVPGLCLPVSGEVCRQVLIELGGGLSLWVL